MLYINIDTNLCLFQELKNQLVDLKDTNETTALDMIHADNVKHGRDKYKTLKVILYKHRRSFLFRFFLLCNFWRCLKSSFKPRMRKYVNSAVISTFFCSKFAVAIQNSVWINSSACKNRDEENDKKHTHTHTTTAWQNSTQILDKSQCTYCIISATYIFSLLETNLYSRSNLPIPDYKKTPHLD